jgi:ATP-binding cassette, subfamily B, bacterial PglK
MFDLMRRCYGLVGEGRRVKWFALVILALLVTAVEAIGAGLIFVLLALITDPHAAPDLPIVGSLGRYVGTPVDERLILSVALGIAAFFILRSVLLGQTYAQQRAAHTAGALLATRLLRGYLTMPYAFHLRRNSAEFIRNALESVQSVINHLVMPTVRLIAEVLIVAGLLLLLVAVSPLATALAAALLGPLVWLVMRIVHPRVKRLGRQAQRAKRVGTLEAVGFKLGRWVDTVLMQRELGAGSRTPPSAGREAGGR